QSTARRWGASASYAAVGQMLAAGGLDGVVVCVPAHEYGPVVTRCVEAGVPVYCEKPSGRSSAELLGLAELAAARHCEVVVGYMKRFAPAYDRARQLIRSASFGDPTLAHFSFVMGQFEGYVTGEHDDLG